MLSLEPTVAFAGQLLAALAAATSDAPGVTRDAYGPGEQIAHDLVRAAANRLGAMIEIDAAGNLFMTRPGTDRTLPAIVFGSHLDSVAHGGNYDGAAGVVAGLAVIEVLARNGIELARDIIVMATRAEEAVWFPLSYPGAKAALGLLPADALGVRRVDTGRTLAEHLSLGGFDPVAVGAGAARLRVAQIAAFVELHIEQGPRLSARNVPLGIVTAINGGFRYPAARCLGVYAHSGAEPRFSRQDSVLGFVDLVTGLETLWDGLVAEGHELTITFGRVESDPSQHGGSRVLGELGFSIDVRCEYETVLDRIDAGLQAVCLAVEQRRGVVFVLGERFSWPAASMAPSLVARLNTAAQKQNLVADTLSSGAGHDTAVFAKAGVPSAMIFVRSTNGSHNPREHLEIEDLAKGVALMVEFARSFDA